MGKKMTMPIKLSVECAECETVIEIEARRNTLASDADRLQRKMSQLGWLPLKAGDFIIGCICKKCAAGYMGKKIDDQAEDTVEDDTDDADDEDGAYAGNVRLLADAEGRRKG